MCQKCSGHLNTKSRTHLKHEQAVPAKTERSRVSNTISLVCYNYLFVLLVQQLVVNNSSYSSLAQIRKNIICPLECQHFAVQQKLGMPEFERISKNYCYILHIFRKPEYLKETHAHQKVTQVTNSGPYCCAATMPHCPHCTLHTIIFHFVISNINEIRNMTHVQHTIYNNCKFPFFKKILFLFMVFSLHLLLHLNKYEVGCLKEDLQTSPALLESYQLFTNRDLSPTNFSQQQEKQYIRMAKAGLESHWYLKSSMCSSTER